MKDNFAGAMRALMKITDIRATTVTIPLEAPLCHTVSCHWGRAGTIVDVETNEPDKPSPLTAVFWLRASIPKIKDDL